MEHIPENISKDIIHITVLTTLKMELLITAIAAETALETALETDLYRYTCLSIRSGKKYVNVLHNKKTQRNIVFHKTKEGVIFTPYVLNDSIALGPIEPWRKKEEYLNEQVLDDENNQILNQLTEDSNPILIEYILKKE